MDYASVAQGAVVALTPVLPYLTQTGEKLAEKLKGKLEDAVLKKADDVWNAIKSKFSSKPSANEALEDAAKNSKDADAVASLRRQITKILEEDPALAGRIAELLKSGNVAQNTGAIKIGRDNTGIANTGNINIGK